MSAYVPDPTGWLVFVADDRALLVGGEPSADFVTAAWTAVRDGAGAAVLLDLLTASGLSATPPFALLERDANSTRVVVRGAVEVVVAPGDAVSGAGLSTWTERTVEGRPPVRAIVSQGEGTELPLVAGVVRAGALALGASPLPAPGQSASAATPADDGTTEVLPDPVATAVLPTEEPPAVPAVDDATIITEATIAEAPEARELPEEPADEAGGYDYLFGATVMRPVKDAAVQTAPPEDAAVGPAREGDHDGQTILASDLQRLRDQPSPEPRAATQPAPAPVFTVVLPSGARESLTGTMLVGRAPSVSRVSGDQLPRLVTIADRDNDISRNHVQLSVEGDTVVVTDLHSKNGTVVVLPGRDPQKLRAGEPASVIAGTVIDLGGGIELVVEQA